MEEQPSHEPQGCEAKVAQSGPSKALRFSRQLGIVLIVSLAASTLYALIFGPQTLRGFSDGLFIVGALLLIFGLLPLVADIFGRSTVSFRLKDQTLEDVLEKQRARTQRNDVLIYLLSVSGVIVIVLSFLIGFSLN